MTPQVSATHDTRCLPDPGEVASLERPLASAEAVAAQQDRDDEPADVLHAGPALSPASQLVGHMERLGR